MYCGIVGYPFGLPPYVLMVGNLLLSISYHAHEKHITMFRHDIIRDMTAPWELMQSTFDHQHNNIIWVKQGFPPDVSKTGLRERPQNKGKSIMRQCNVGVYFWC